MWPLWGFVGVKRNKTKKIIKKNAMISMVYLVYREKYNSFCIFCLQYWEKGVYLNHRLRMINRAQRETRKTTMITVTIKRTDSSEKAKVFGRTDDIQDLIRMFIFTYASNGDKWMIHSEIGKKINSGIVGK